MKKTYFGAIFAVVMLITSLALHGCSKSEKEELSSGIIYGIVSDFATGDPISNVNVKLRPSGETTLTGSDGMFQFNDVKNGDYTLFFLAAGYRDLNDDYTITVADGRNIRRDVQLSALSQSFKLTVNGMEVDTIDFGLNPSTESITISVTNDGSISLDDVGIRLSVSWLYFLKFTPSEYHASNESLGSISPYEGKSAIVRIDRTRLYIGENIGCIYVTSGALTKTYFVKAIGVGMPVVEIPTLTDITTSTCIASSSVSDDGGFQITDKGFEYDGNAVYDNGSISLGPGGGAFQAQIPRGTHTIYGKVRAYASNGVYKAYSGWKYIAD